MKFGFDISENSTKRGLVWIVTSIIGTVMLFMGKDLSQLIVLATAAAGGLGVGLKDNAE